MKRPVLILTMIALFLSIQACNFVFQPDPTEALPQRTQTATSTETSARAPVQATTPPITATVVATVTPTPHPTATLRTMPPNRVLIMVLGSDYRPRKGYRTDVVMLLTVDTRDRTVSALSFPRDLYVAIPGREPNRINTVFPRGGFELLSETLEVNFGLRPDFYVMANMQVFSEIVEGLDGVTVEVDQVLRDKCDRSLDLADDEGYCQVAAGSTEMDGPTALWYVRSRYSTSDFDRLRRAQEVLFAIFSKLVSLDAIARWPSVYLAYRENVRTNIEIDDILPLLPAAVEVYRNPARLSRYVVTRMEVTPFRNANGASVLLPDYRKISEIIDDAVFAP